MRYSTHIPAALAVCIVLFSTGCSDTPASGSNFRNPKMPMERRVNDIIRRMRPEEKLALVEGARRLSYQGNERLGIPPLSAVEGAMGISARDASGKPIPATAFPANIGIAATWNPELAEAEGAAIAQEARALGRGQVLGPVAGVSVSPLSGRLFETYGDNPYLVSRIATGFIGGVQGEGEIATAVYDSGEPDSRAAREFGLRPLEAAVTEGGVWSVMPRDGTAPVSALMNSFLNWQLGFRGFAAHPGPAGVASDADLESQTRGVLRAMFASGVFDRDTGASGKVETPEHRATARTAAEQSIVLLKNAGNLLPLDPAQVRSVAVLGPNANVNRMASGSYTVAARYSETPLEVLRAVFGSKLITAADASNESAAKAARSADVAIVLVGTGAATEAETRDRASFDLPPGQDELIAAVSGANPRTVVVLIGGSPFVAGRWLARVPALLDAWFPGEEGGPAISRVLTGQVNPSGRLPVAFPEFPFGFGLSYTRFEYTDLVIMPDHAPPGQFAEVSLNVRNAGTRAGRETVQLYLHAVNSRAGVSRGEQLLRGFRQLELQPGEQQRVRFTLNPDATSYFDETRGEWAQDQAVFDVRVGSSSGELPATGRFAVTE